MTPKMTLQMYKSCTALIGVLQRQERLYVIKACHKGQLDLPNLVSWIVTHTPYSTLRTDPPISDFGRFSTHKYILQSWFSAKEKNMEITL